MFTGDLPMPVAAAPFGWAVACSRAGAAHQRSGTSCQDAYALWSGAVSGTPCLVAAVADGHGDARHDRSQCGAALAVQAAVEVAREFCLAYGEAEALDALRHDFTTHFPRRLGQRWRAAVCQEARTQEETIFTRYGTTLLVALVVPGTLLVGQLGDGALLWVTARGCQMPFDVSRQLLGPETHSLCSPDASQLWQTTSLGYTTEGLLMLTTDGLTDSLGDGQADLEPFVQSLRQRLHEFGPVQVAAALPTWLDHYSTHGSGDDMTLALVWLAAPEGGSKASVDSGKENTYEFAHGPAGDSGSPAEHPDGQAEAR